MVEILVGVVLVGLILLLAGVDIWYLLMGVLGLVTLAALLTVGFFTVSMFMLISSRRCSGVLTQFVEGKRFGVAEYLIDGELHNNIFPAEAEGPLRSHMYHPGKPVKLFLARNGRTFDKNALLTTCVGLPVSIAVSVAFGFCFFVLAGIL